MVTAAFTMVGFWNEFIWCVPGDGSCTAQDLVEPCVVNEVIVIPIRRVCELPVINSFS